MLNKRNFKHGLKGTRIEGIWHGIKQRCLNPNNHAFKYYGGRGINICDRWANSLQNFLDDMGHPPDKYTIDRIDNQGNYELSNCKWVSRAEQQSNRRCNRFIEYKGERKTAMQWSKELGIPSQTVYNRIKLNMPVEDILSTGKHINKDGLKLGGKANGERNKAKTHCPHGHEYTPENTAPNGKNGRSCRKCRAISEQIRRDKRKNG